MNNRKQGMVSPGHEERQGMKQRKETEEVVVYSQRSGPSGPRRSGVGACMGCSPTPAAYNIYGE